MATFASRSPSSPTPCARRRARRSPPASSPATGRPKGAMVTHGQSLRVYEVWTEVIGLREGDRYLVVNPFFHTFGYKAGWMSCIIRGATIVPHAVFDVPSVLERVQAERISVLP